MHVCCSRKKLLLTTNIVVSGQWFRDNGVSVLDCPPCSPDANPTENIWRNLKVAANAHHSRNEWAAVQATLLEISLERVHALVESVSRQVESIWKARRGTRSNREKSLHQRNVSKSSFLKTQKHSKKGHSARWCTPTQTPITVCFVMQ